MAVPASTSWLRPLRWSAPDPIAVRPPEEGFALPVGTVTFLLTDVENSTLGWQAAPDLMGPAIARHYEILEQAVAANGGVRPQEQGEGDSIVGAFGRASDALKAAVEAQQRLAEETWDAGLRAPIRVRMAIHTGEAQMRNEANYVGQAIIRTARLRAIAHGEQILVSQATRDLAVDQLGDAIELIDLGTHRLKDLARPEHVWQVVAPALHREFPPLNSLDAIPNNLPIDLSTFVGRHAEINTVVALSEQQRLVTITGAGGAGKTRLAQQVAAQLADRFEDGAWWIELAPLEATAVLAVVAGVVSVSDPAKLAEGLASRTALLVFDNCEHVLEAVAPLVAAIVRTCPNVSVLATSRGPLDVPGEVTWRVPPLAVPEADEPAIIERIAQFDAVRLFIDRAQRTRPNFALTTENGPTVAELCTRLDGIPLAIELAAARAKSLTPAQILSGLEDSLRLLTGGSRLVMPRQQTLEASIAWSHNLLGERERILLRRLSVFAGGWDLEAAENVCGDAGGNAVLEQMEVLDSLERLIDQSIIRFDDHAGTGRYHLLETVRQYGARQLSESGERQQIVRAHTEWFRQLAISFGAQAEGPDQLTSQARLIPERDNITAALRQLQHTGRAGDLGETVLALSTYWDNIHEGNPAVAWTTTALEALGDQSTTLRARLLAAHARHLQLSGHWDRVFPAAQAAFSLANEIGDRRAAGRSGGLLGMFTTILFDRDAGMAMLERAADDVRAAGDLWGEAIVRSLTTGAHVMRGEIVLARAALEQAAPIVRRLGDPSLLKGWHAQNAAVCLATGDHEGVRTSLDTAEANGYVHPLGQTLRLRCDVTIAADRGEDGPSIEYLHQRLRHFQRIDQPMAVVHTRTHLMQAHHLRGEFALARAAGAVLMEKPFGSDPTGFDAFGYDALAAIVLGDLTAAKNRLQQLQPVMTKVSRVLAANIHLTTGFVARLEGDLAGADREFHAALAVATDEMLRRDALLALEMLAGLAAAHGSWHDAARLAGCAQQQRDERTLHSRIEPFASRYADDTAAARNALGSDTYDAAFAEGRSLSLDDAVAFASRTRGERGRPTIGWASLTPTERRVADLARIGRTNFEIGRELLMGVETVKTHLSRIYAKLDVGNRTKLAALVPPSD